MVAGQRNFHRVFAHVSPVFVSLSLALLCTSSLAPLSWGAETTRHSNADVPGGTKRSAASAQFAKAEEQRAALNSKASEKRMLADYKLVVATYRHVALITARAPEVPDALVALGELYTEMGDRFGRNYYQFAVDSYQFLAREYPRSRYTQDAVLRTAKLQRDQLNEPALAMKTYADFLKRFPRSSRKREAQESMAELALLQNSGSSAGEQSAGSPGSGNPGASTRDTGNQSAATKSAPVKISEGRPQESVTDDAEMAPASGTGRGAHTVSGGMSRADAETIPRLRRIRTSATGDATRVTIDLEDSVQYSSARIANPDRIFFDLHAARLTPELARNNIKTEGELLTGIRVAQNHSGVVRVVLDINGVKDYTASLTHNPAQLLIDLYGGSAHAPVQTAKAKRGAHGEDDEAEQDKTDGTQVAEMGRSSADAPTAAAKGPSGRGAIAGSTGAAPNTTNSDGGPGSTAIRNTLPTAKTARSKAVNSGDGNGKPELVQPVSAPQPKRDGGSTLTRTLGLKIGRIVIDAGHGGHDTGTIGPTGLMEKDLCLDVALRLGRIIQQRLPGADVVYTRSDDTFIPLEERTAIANQARADLFISIHANSSQDHGARGVETYYLNLKGSADAMEVAARENASSQQGIHDLEDLVKQIARTEKIDESKELAQDVQGSLTQRMQKAAKTVKNRGVRKAPFVVLIGADMPSILTEISFLSNPADEVLLKKPEHRQRVAEGIYQGVASYLQSLNSVTVNLPPRLPSGKADDPSKVRPVEQSRNQN
jgi:N-acetylmuramoyl-L-alanine amidase